METNNSGVENREEEAQKMLRQLDDLEGHYDSVENDVFDHKTRNAVLQNGEFDRSIGFVCFNLVVS